MILGWWVYHLHYLRCVINMLLLCLSIENIHILSRRCLLSSFILALELWTSTSYYIHFWFNFFIIFFLFIISRKYFLWLLLAFFLFPLIAITLPAFHSTWVCILTIIIWVESRWTYHKVRIIAFKWYLIDIVVTVHL